MYVSERYLSHWIRLPDEVCVALLSSAELCSRCVMLHLDCFSRLRDQLPHLTILNNTSAESKNHLGI